MIPEISVLIPVYNAEKYLPQCLASLQKQTFTNFEIVCVNDGSSDNSVQILQIWTSQEPRLRVISQAQSGVAVARNRLLEQARGKYIAFVDADDWVEPDYLEKLYAAAVRTGADITKCFFIEYDEKTGPCSPKTCSSGFYQLPSPKPSHRLLGGHYDSVVWGKLYLRSWVEKENIHFLPGYVAEDVSFALLSFLTASVIFIVPEILYIYRRGLPKAISSNQENMFVGIVNNHFHVCDQLSQRKNIPATGWDIMSRLFIGDLARLRKLDKSRQVVYQGLFSQTIDYLHQIKKYNSIRGKLINSLFFILAGNKMNKKFYFWAKVFR